MPLLFRVLNLEASPAEFLELNCDHKSFTRLLPKENFREPFGLPKIKVGSPSNNFRSPELTSD